MSATADDVAELLKFRSRHIGDLVAGAATCLDAGVAERLIISYERLELLLSNSFVPHAAHEMMLASIFSRIRTRQAWHANAMGNKFRILHSLTVDLAAYLTMRMLRDVVEGAPISMQSGDPESFRLLREVVIATGDNCLRSHPHCLDDIGYFLTYDDYEVRLAALDWIAKVSPVIANAS